MPPRNINDVMWEALVNKGYTDGGMTDKLNAFWGDASGITGTLNDKKMHFLQNKTCEPLSGQHITDLSYEWLATLGYTQESLESRWYSFWADGAPIPTPACCTVRANLPNSSPEERAIVCEFANELYYAGQWDVFSDIAIFWLEDSADSLVGIKSGDPFNVIDCTKNTKNWETSGATYSGINHNFNQAALYPDGDNIVIGAFIEDIDNVTRTDFGGVWYAGNSFQCNLRVNSIQSPANGLAVEMNAPGVVAEYAPAGIWDSPNINALITGHRHPDTPDNFQVYWNDVEIIDQGSAPVSGVGVPSSIVPMIGGANLYSLPEGYLNATWGCGFHASAQVGGVDFDLPGFYASLIKMRSALLAL